MLGKEEVVGQKAPSSVQAKVNGKAGPSKSRPVNKRSSTLARMGGKQQRIQEVQSLLKATYEAASTSTIYDLVRFKASLDLLSLPALS